MLARTIACAALWLVTATPAYSQICGAFPYTLTNGTTADANQVMGDFNHLRNCVNNITSFLRGWLSGLTMSNNVASPNTVVDTAAGVANSDDASTLMSLAAFTKNANAAWAVGSGNGCLDSGSALAANTWYHLFVVARTDTGVVDQLCSTSAAAPTLPSNYTKKRRIGSFKTNSSSQIRAFSQYGDEFIWATPVQDINVSNQGTSLVTYTLASVPNGIKVNALVRGYMYYASGQVNGLIIPDGDGSTAQASPLGNSTINTPSAIATVTTLNLRTSAAQQIKAVASQASTTFVLVTYGWTDSRGRFD